ncbi:MAG: TIGR02450 family Trp-rich protein [Methylococcaceae bacterium]|nr:TIGR02450 family Trp-rich protein [Methylococcaceae bacterium]MDP3904857.1 TIGR02450 family Trp-rich protein [Methylococcaceae bacterium]
MNKNQINPQKLLLSKWTAVTPNNKEKHFLVTRIEVQELLITACILEAVINGHEYQINWRELKNASIWLAGWQ